MATSFGEPIQAIKTGVKKVNLTETSHQYNSMVKEYGNRVGYRIRMVIITTKL